MGYEHPLFIAETVGIIGDHCDETLAQAMLAEAEAQARGNPSGSSPVAQCSGPGSFEDDVWTELWRAFASRRPELFGQGLSALSEHARGISLAWLFTRQETPQLLRPLAGSELAPEFWGGFHRLVEPGGLPLPGAISRYWQVSADNVIARYVRHHGWAGLSFFCEPSLRSDTAIFVTSPDWELLLHEQLHHALTQLACPGKVVLLGSLMTAINEAVVELLTRAARGLGADNLAGFVDQLWLGPYSPEVQALLSLLPPLTPDNLTTVLRLGAANLAGASDEATARLLSALAGEPRSAEDWLSYFSWQPDRDASVVSVLYADGRRGYLWRTGKTQDSAVPSLSLVRDDGVGTDYWLREGKLHREAGPAVIATRPDGSNSEGWWLDGARHREDGPAWVARGADGTRIEKYFRRNSVHHDDGPAVIEIRPDGSKQALWYCQDRCHREDGPALIEIQADGTRVEEYYCHHELHRENGPAMVKTLAGGTRIEIYSYHDKRHRDDGPAYVAIKADGTRIEEYSSEDLLHREGGPAVIERRPNGVVIEEWWWEGKLHREDGPAITFARPDGTLSEEQSWRRGLYFGREVSQS